MNRYQTDVVAGTVVVDTGALEAGPAARREEVLHAPEGPELHRRQGVLTCPASAPAPNRSSPRRSNGA